MVIIDRCKVCGSNKLIVLKKYRVNEKCDSMWQMVMERVFEKKRTFSIRLSMCLTCGFVFYKDILDFKEIAKFYEIEYRHGEVEKSSKKRGRKMEISKIFEFFEKNVDFGKINSVIDVGAGDFVVLEKIMKLYPSINFSAIDPSYPYSQYGNAKVLKLMVENFEVENKFDLILLVHILEHVASFENFMSKIEKMAVIGGYIYVEVPFQIGPGLFFNRAANTQHINYFTPISIRNLLLKYNFKIKKMDFDKTGFRYNGMPGMIRILARKEESISFKIKRGVLNSAYYLISPLIFLKSKI